MSKFLVKKYYFCGVRTIELRNKFGHSIMYRLRANKSLHDKCDRISDDIESLASEYQNNFPLDNRVIYFLESLQINRNIQSKGHGSKFLKEIKSMASKEKAVIFLQARNRKDEQNHHRLLKFYKANKFGMVCNDNDEDFFVWEPR